MKLKYFIMKKIYLLVVFTIINISLFAQSPTLDWAMKLGSNVKNTGSGIFSGDHYSGYNIYVGQDGYVYSVGKFAGSIDFDSNNQFDVSSILNNGFSYYILKQDNQGNIVWKKFIGCCYDCQFGMKLDKYDNLNLLIGNSFDIILDSNITNSNSIILNPGLHFVRLNSNGDFIWNKDFLTGNSYNFIASYLFDSKNNLYAFGAINETKIVDFNPGIDSFNVAVNNKGTGFIFKLNNDGEFIWVKTIGDSLGKCVNVFSSIDKNDNIYFSGRYSDSIDIDLGPNKQYLYINDPVKQAFHFLGNFISKIDTSGNLVWAKDFHNKGLSYLTNDIQNNLIVNSNFIDSITFSNATNQQTFYSTTNNTYIAKYKENGDYIWAKHLGDLEIYSIQSDKVGNIYSNGNFINTTFLNSDDTTIKTTSKGNYDMYLLKLDSSGNHIFDFITGGKKNDKCFGLDIDEDFNIYMTGTFNDTIDFDPSSVVENLNCHDTVRSIFITKFNQYPLAVNSVSKNSIAKLYPNPNNGIFTIDIKENAIVMITNSFGQMVSKTQIKKGISTFNLQNHSAGIYFVQLLTDKDFETIKIVKE